jgi:hypothetical protein
MRPPTPLLQSIYAAMADAHVTLALCVDVPPSSSPILFDIPPPPPALKPDVLAALALPREAAGAGAAADAASFIADAASAWCRRFVQPPPSLYALELLANAASSPLPYTAGAGLIEAEVTRHSMDICAAATPATAGAATASICHEALSCLPIALRQILHHASFPL